MPDYRESDLDAARALVPELSTKRQERVALALADAEREGRKRAIAMLRERAERAESAHDTVTAVVLRKAATALESERVSVRPAPTSTAEVVRLVPLPAVQSEEVAGG